jgi:hypothetical protein
MLLDDSGIDDCDNSGSYTDSMLVKPLVLPLCNRCVLGAAKARSSAARASRVL